MRLLIVEDERTLADVLARGFREQGYAVDTAHDGEGGLHFAESEPYDLIVLDLMLPKLNGYEVCRRLRAARSRVPILMLTARDSVDDRVGGLDSGADDYLIKPFAFRELLARVRALLRREGLSKNPLLRAGDLELDTSTRSVRRGERAVELTSKEYAILEYFVRNPNRVLSRTQIAEHTWDHGFVALSNVVDVYVRALRRKLRDDHEPRLLRTVRGVGYQLKVAVA
jgi:DNA-binding response OmpR family regulator